MEAIHFLVNPYYKVLPYLMIVGMNKEMCGFHKKCTWINSSVIAYAKKSNTSTGTT